MCLRSQSLHNQTLVDTGWDKETHLQQHHHHQMSSDRAFQFQLHSSLSLLDYSIPSEDTVACCCSSAEDTEDNHQLRQ